MTKIKKLWNIQEVRTKLLYTGLFLLLFRLGCGIAAPFINAEMLTAIFGSGNALGYLNMVSGGALSRCAVFALGVAPYINASIIVQLLSIAIPSWEAAKKEPDGKERLERYTKYIALILAIVMAVGYLFVLRSYGALEYTQGVASWFAGAVIVAVFVAGAQFTVWLGNQIDERGIGNGVSLIIFAGIVARWETFYSVYNTIRTGLAAGEWAKAISALIALIVVGLAMMWFTVYVSGTERRIPVIFSGKSGRTKMYMGNMSSHIPLKLIMSGVMPIIFASAVLSVPQTIGLFVDAEKYPAIASALLQFNTSNWLYCILYVVFIFAFNYFYVSVQYDPVQMSNNLRVNGGAIPGIRPGKPTSDHLAMAMRKLAGTGSLALALIALAPIAFGNVTGLAIQLGGTSLLIVVNVATELLQSLDSYSTVRYHKGFIS